MAAEGSSIPVTLKWGKQTFSLSITVGDSVSILQQRVQEVTGVPVGRQKLLSKKAWKGPLKSDAILSLETIQMTTPLVVTLIGSAETLKEPTTPTIFLEDLSLEDLQKAEEEELQAAMGTATGMIQALQLPPHRRDDHKQEVYEYNRLVTGLPQRQIESELLQQQQPPTKLLQGKVAMTLGLELRRAYINDLAVLDDGTCVSALDDGHVQLWKHAAQEADVIHPAAGPIAEDDGGVTSVVALTGGAFATAGRGSFQVWNSYAEPVVTFPGAMPGTTPASLTSVEFNHDDDTHNGDIICLAARFQVTRHANPQQFRLPPQNESERQRRAQAEAQEEAIQQALDKASQSIQVWFSVGGGDGGGETIAARSWQSQILKPDDEEAAPITCLTTMPLHTTTANDDDDGTTMTTKLLIAGDAAGGLRIWKVQRQENTLQFLPHACYQLPGASIVCLEPLQDNRLAVSTQQSNNPVLLSQATSIATSSTIPSRAVHILDFSTTERPTLVTSLTGHADKDAVICMKQLPNGDLLTGGGKLDATLQLWTNAQLLGQSDDGQTNTTTTAVVPKPHKSLSEVGYVFAIEVLPDAKQDSSYYAVAVARYNTVKIIL